jgi:DNA-directed RNA polymerase specialized sigma24 family protein
MPEPSFHTVNLIDWLARIRSGDRDARDDLLRACQARLERLARRMLRGYPAVRQQFETADVFQGASIRLLRALEATPVADTRQFFNLAAAIIRRELIDLARRPRGPRGGNGPGDGPDVGDDPAALDRWCALHEAVENLPAEEREVFGLTFYHGWTQDRIADLFGVDVRTVRRRWRAAADALHKTLGGDLPCG